jgi:uncharacterized protein YjbI with pentapeptide repeats
VGQDWSGADLAHAQVTEDAFEATNFSNVNLTGASFTNDSVTTYSPSDAYPNMTGVDFTNANLKGTSFAAQTSFTGAIWSNTTCPDGTNSNNDGNTCVNDLKV